MTDNLLKIIITGTSSDAGVSIPDKLRKITPLLFMRDEGIYTHPEMLEFLYVGRHFDRVPADILLFFLDKSDPPGVYREAIVNGCLDCIEAFKSKITTGQSSEFANDSPAGQKNLQALNDLLGVLPQMMKYAPMLASALAPAVHNLLDLCHEHNVSPSVKRLVTGIAANMDGGLLWDEAQERRWIDLLNKPSASVWAFNYILVRDPRHPILDSSIAGLACKILSGEEKEQNLIGLLINYFRKRNRDETFIARMFGQIPEELFPRLAIALQEGLGTDTWLKYIPVRRTTAAPEVSRREKAFE